MCIFVGNPNKIWIYDWAFELGRLNISFSWIIAELTKVGHNYRKQSQSKLSITNNGLIFLYENSFLKV